MKTKWLAFLTVLFSSCASNPSNQERMYSYLSALEHAQHLKQPAEVDLNKAVEKFIFFYSDFSPAQIQQHMDTLYAEDAYFRDSVREVMGLKAMKDYFKNSVKDIYKCSFEMVDISHHLPHTYVRWVMSLQKNSDDKPQKYVGMSHLIFNDKGQLSFHQDYWDFSELLQEAPILGGLLTRIKNSI